MGNPSLTGSKLGKYQIQAEVGRGGMAVVYRGHDPVLDRPVAVKVLAPYLGWQKGAVERFLREARSAARLRHPNIVHIYDVGQQGSNYYYVMEYLEGRTLAEEIRRRGPLDPEEVVAILRRLAGALSYAHENRLVHRDVKPSNIVVGRAGRVTLTDFGIAWAAHEKRLTATGTVVGTPEYVSPEQMQGLPVDACSDQYSLAVVAYEILSGQVPFKGEDTLGLAYRVVHEPPPRIREVRPDLPAGVDEVLAKALAKEPGDRYPNVKAFVAALSGALAGERAKPLHSRRVAPVAAAPTPMNGAQRPVAAEAAAAGRAATSNAAPAAARRESVLRQDVPVWPVWLWALAGLTVAALLVLSGVLLAGGGWAGSLEVTPSLTAVVAQPTDVPQAIVVAAPATATLRPTVPPVMEELVPSPTEPPPATERPPATEPPAAIETVASATPRPSPTPTLTSSPTPEPAATATKAKPTSAPPATIAPTPFPAPVLLEPTDGADLAGKLQFRWDWKHAALPEDHYFDLRIWSDGEQDLPQASRRGALEPTRMTTAVIDLAGVPAVREYGTGTYYWSVVVVKRGADAQSPTIVGQWAPDRSFLYSAPGGRDGEATPPRPDE